MNPPSALPPHVPPQRPLPSPPLGARRDPARPEIIRAPHADPFGQFRPAPTGGRRTTIVTVGIVIAVAVAFVVPFILDANLELSDDRFFSTEDVLEEYVPTEVLWPLTFSSLDRCDGVSNGELMVANFDCRNSQVRITGLEDVTNPLISTVRSAQSLGYEQVDTTAVNVFTARALQMNPELTKDAELDDIYLVNPMYSANPLASDKDTSYVVTFYQEPRSEIHDGVLVAVEVTANTADVAYQETEDIVRSAATHD